MDPEERAARERLDRAVARGDARNTAHSTESLGLILYIQQRYKEAEAVLSRAVGLFERSYGPDNWYVGSSLGFLGAALNDQSRYAEAESVLRRALGVRGFTGLTDVPSGKRMEVMEEVASVHRMLAMALLHQHRLDEADQFARSGLSIQERATGPNDERLIVFFGTRAAIAQASDRLDEVMALSTRTLTIAEASLRAKKPVPGEEPTAARTFVNVAGQMANAGRYDEAEGLLRRGLALLLETVGPDHTSVAHAHQLQGQIAGERGRYAEADRAFKTALAILEKAHEPDAFVLVEPLRSLSVLDFNQGRFAEGEPLLRRAWAISTKILGPDHPTTIHLALLLSWACREQGRDAEADRLSEGALAAMERALGPDHSGFADALYLVAIHRAARKQYAEAERLSRRAIASAEKTPAGDSLNTTHRRYQLAYFVALQDRFEESLALYDRVIADYKRLGAMPAYRSHALVFRAIALSRLKRLPEAIDDLRRAIDLAEQQRGELAGAERERAVAFARSGSAFEKMVSMQLRVERGTPDLAAVFDAMERAHARTLLEEMGLAGTDLNAGLPPAERAALRAREEGLKRQVRQAELSLSRLTRPDDPARGPLTAALAQARNALYEHDRDARANSPVYRSMLSRTTTLPTFDEVRQSLLPGDLMLMFLLGEDDGFLLAVTHDGARPWRISLNAEEAAALGVDEGPLTADRLRRALINEKGSGLAQRLADPRAEVPLAGLAALADTVIPLDQKKALADGTVKRLIVVPDGPLALLPFEALVMERGEEPKYLLDVGPPVVYAPSAAVLKRLAERPMVEPLANREPVLALGDPAYPAGEREAPADEAQVPTQSRSRYALAGGRLPRLPYSGWEAQWVAKAFNDQGVPAATLSAQTATEAGVRYWSPGRRVLHLACHGLADRELGNFYGALALAPGPKADDPSNDGFLTLSEIHALDLSHCELAILSACETNLGPQQKGEGTWALSRGFLVAGSRRVLASNWLVDDEAAASLVSVYCTLLAKAESDGKTVDYAGALREAKRWVRGQEKWKAPYYWASLVLVGPP
jgi:CHAT domain-containing protein/tetratricopeptide (TPR) repeat protein